MNEAKSSNEAAQFPPPAEAVAAIAGLENDARIVASLHKARNEIIAAGAVVRANL